MLFNSFEFLLVFLPISAALFYFLSLFRKIAWVLIWLVLCSLFFQAYGAFSSVVYFVISMLINYIIGQYCRKDSGQAEWVSRGILVCGIVFNLSLLCWFKYVGFFADLIGGWKIGPSTELLPLAISFYTFQQIAYIVDAWAGRAPRYTVLEYVSYLAFFPHLIAGPIVRHDDLVKQLNEPAIMLRRAGNLMAGLSMLFIGLFKKVVLADGASTYSDPFFKAVQSGGTLGAFDAWSAAFMFAFVIYFDFSGYSDMAIGLARLFNVKLPENFASPYKAVNIIEFWRRWHITLSAFLRDYLYVPLGGSRRGDLRRYTNIMATMLLGGLWHGAGLTFILWGGLHGVFIVAAHFWRDWKRVMEVPTTGLLGQIVGRVLTFLCVSIAWVFFRANSAHDAFSVLYGMIGFNGLGSSEHVELPDGLLGNPMLSMLVMMLVLSLIVFWLPNTQQIMRPFHPVLHMISDRACGFGRLFVWRMSAVHATVCAAMGIYAISQLENIQSFIYFRF